MQINWKVRLRNKAFWVAIIPMALLLTQQVAALFGVALDLGQTGDKLLAIVGTVFGLLATFGVVNDPTTAGIEDSALAMTYEVPKHFEEIKKGERK